MDHGCAPVYPDPREETMRRTLWPLAALAMIAAVVAGCGNGSAGTGSGGNSTAAAPAGSGSSAASHNSTATTREKAVKFAECMRANGVSAFPDPNASGELTIDAVANGSSLDTSSAAFKQAMSACRGLEPPGFTGGKVTPSQRTARLEFAQCMRENGVPDFPDPTPNGPLVDTNRIPSSNTTAGMTILNAAMHKCGARYSGQLGLKRQ
jgi:hypothetical protein